MRTGLAGPEALSDDGLAFGDETGFQWNTRSISDCRRDIFISHTYLAQPGGSKTVQRALPAFSPVQRRQSRCDLGPIRRSNGRPTIFVDVEPFQQRHHSIKTGKGSLNFKLTDELPEFDIREVIKRAISRS